MWNQMGWFIESLILALKSRAGRCTLMKTWFKTWAIRLSELEGKLATWGGFMHQVPPQPVSSHVSELKKKEKKKKGVFPDHWIQEGWVTKIFKIKVNALCSRNVPWCNKYDRSKVWGHWISCIETLLWAAPRNIDLELSEIIIDCIKICQDVHWNILVFHENHFQCQIKGGWSLQI